MANKPKLNCARFATYDDALAAFLRWCPSERGGSCEGCPFQDVYSCMGRWLMSASDETAAHSQLTLDL